MCRLLLLGYVLQLGGIGVLMMGLARTRAAFDEDFEPLWTRVQRRTAEWRARRRATREGAAAAAVPRPGAGRGGEGGDPLDAAGTVTAPDIRDLLRETRDQLRGEMLRHREELQALLDEEAAKREAGDGRLRGEVSDLALGGLWIEWWGAASILCGIVLVGTRDWLC